MSIGLLFWILAILAFIGVIGPAWDGPRFGWFAPYSGALLFVLVCLLGWATFGPPIR